ncbi:Di-copper centre-containing protein [Paxillus ammoniavirescens]|nr:Di-copper centre-containing protein [Paxillus ammoniavirescens]
MTTVKARDYYPITGRSSTGGTFDRIPVEELKAHHPYQWTLFVLGFAWIKGTPIPFPGVVQPPLKTSLSLMEIGGIHGRPYREWAGDRRTHDEALADFSGVDKKDTNPSPSRFGGYCNHAAITFPTWHRPYVMLIEQAIGDYAENVAQQIENSNSGEVGLWVKASKELRFPYWDWADPKVEKEGLPSLFYDDQLTVTATGHKTVTVPNPLSFFNFPYIPEDFKDTTRNGVTAHFSVWPKTYRHAADSATPVGSNIADLQTTLKQQAEDLRTKVGMLFSFPDGGDSSIIYDQFSNTRNESRQEDDNTTVGPLEGVHNSIHGAIGGNGHMGNPDYAGFDPFFYFHHSNVDRIISLWEWCYPSYWMNNGYTVEGVDYSWNQQYGTYAQAYNEKLEEDGEFGRLVPWRHPDGSYWTNKETRFLTPDAFPKYYSYKEFLGVKVDKPAANLQQQQEARARIAKFYSVDPQTSAQNTTTLAHVPVPGVGEVDLPSNFQSIKGFRLFIILARLPEHAFGRSYNFQVFYKGNNLIGNITVFAREDDSPCKACALRRESASLVRGVISIPPRIVHEIIVNSGIDRTKNTMDITTGLVTKALSGKLLDLSGKVLASAQGGEEVATVPASHAASKRVQPVEITLLSSAIAQHANDKNQPVHFFDWKPHKGLFPSGWKAESVEATSTH